MHMQVSRAVSLATGEEVALKRVFPQRAQRGAAPPACNLARELAALRALRHPNVLALRDVLQQARAPPKTLYVIRGVSEMLSGRHCGKATPARHSSQHADVDPACFVMSGPPAAP